MARSEEAALGLRIVVLKRLKTALEVTDVGGGAGHARLLNRLPRGMRCGRKATAFVGGYRLWRTTDVGN
jgi:hypothetical protein